MTAAPRRRDPAQPDIPLDPVVPETIPAFGAAGELEGLLLDHTDLAGAVAPDAHIVECVLRDVRLDGADLAAARLRDLDVRGGTWATADLSRAGLVRIRAAAVDLMGVTVAGGTLGDLHLTECRLDWAVLAGCVLRDVHLERCSLRDADLTGTRLERVRFEECDLSRVRLAGADMSGATLLGCVLDGIRDADRLRGVTMGWPASDGEIRALAAAAGVRLAGPTGHG